MSRSPHRTPLRPATPRATHPARRTLRRVLAAAVTTIAVATPTGVALAGRADAATAPGAVSLSVVAGPVRGGTTVDLTGTAVGSATTAWFGAVPTRVTPLSATKVRVVTPPGSPGVVSVRVSNAAGFSPQTLRSTYAYVRPPTVTRLSATSGPSTGGSTITITGTGLLRTSSVRFGASVATSLRRLSSTQVQVVVPAHAVGPVAVRATTPGGTSPASTASTYAYTTSATRLPVVSRVSPAAGPLSGGQTVTVTGARLGGVTAVTLGGTRAASFTRVSSTTLRVVTPRRPAGTVDVRVRNGSGWSPLTVGDRYAYLPVPTLTGLSPTSGSPAGGTTVTLTGTGLDRAESVLFGSTRTTAVTRLSATTLRVTAPAHASGAVSVRVTTPGGTSGATAGARFTYGGAPTVSGLSVDAGPLAGGTVVVITGTHLEEAGRVLFGGVAATGLVRLTASSVRATSPAHAAGTVDVRVVTPNGTSPVVPAGSFTYEPVPRVTGLSAPAGPIRGGTVLTVTGSSLARARSVTFDGVPGTRLVRVSPTTLRVTTPPHAVGTADVRVVAPGGTSPAAAVARFAYQPVPTVTALSSRLSTTRGGTLVTVTGTGFDRVTTVTVGGVAATFARLSATSLRVTLPQHAEAVVDVRVTTPGGVSVATPATRFTYQDLPLVRSVAPSSGPLAGGTTVTLDGTSFQNASGVWFNGVAATSFTRVSATRLTAVVPSRAWTGAVSVRVTTPAGTVSVASGYTYVAGSTLRGSQSLTAGTALRSPGRAYALTMQTDGNLVLTKGTTRLWAAGTSGAGNRLALSGAGNLAVVSARGTTLWTSATSGWTGATLAMGDDGLAVLRQGSTPVWDHRGMRYDRLLPGQALRPNESLQSVSTGYRLTMRSDGNLVVTTSAGRFRWSALTTGAGNVAVMRTDGSFVVQTRSGTVLWSTRTTDAAGAVVRMLGDGNVAVYDGPRVVWAITGGPGPRSWACYSRGTQTCITRFGYYGQRVWGYPVDGWGNNCTNFSAYRLSRDGVKNPGNLGNAATWDDRARAMGFVVDQKPRVGVIAQWNRNHVAYVDWVSADGNQVAISESGYGGTVLGVTYTSMSGRRILTRGTSSWPSNFIHFR